MTWEQDVLDKWSEEYDVPGVKFTGYVPLGDLAGMAHGRDHGTENERIYIEVDPHYEKHRITCKGILWHEFGHAYDYHYTGTMGHDKGWMKIYMKKPILVLLAFLAPFVRW